MSLLTKSKYLIGLQCPKYLWMVFHQSKKLPKPDAATEKKFTTGNIIGELAKELYPSGIDIPSGDFMGNIKKTEELLSERVPLFEAGFMIDNLFSRVDILEPHPKGGWNIIEVKSSTQVKEINLHDVSFQKFCLEKAGVSIRNCFLMHINNQYVKKGDIDPKGIMVSEDITKEVDELTVDVEKRVKYMRGIIESEADPDRDIGKQCTSPYGCPLEAECWEFLPDNNVFHLYRGGKKSLELYEAEVYAIEDIPDDFKLNAKQSIQRNCARTGKPYIHKEEIKKFLKSLNYPLYYLDFETFNPAIPIYEGMRPYQRIPFQFSLHIVGENKKIKHVSFLAEGKEDPRPKFLEKLKHALDDNGGIVVFNQSFEKGVLKELAESFPKYKKWVELVDVRIVDLLIPFRNFHYYHPIQKGTASIKKILPALTGKGYENMSIDHGGDASLNFEYVTFQEISDNERMRIRKDLEKYCFRDTEGMIWIINELKKLVN